MSYIQLTPLNVNFAVFTLHLDAFDVTHYVWLMVCVARDSERVLTTCVKCCSFVDVVVVCRASYLGDSRLNWISMNLVEDILLCLSIILK